MKYDANAVNKRSKHKCRWQKDSNQFLLYSISSVSDFSGC